MVSMIEQIMSTKYNISLSSVVNPVFGSWVKAALRPNTVRSPVAYGDFVSSCHVLESLRLAYLQPITVQYIVIRFIDVPQLDQYRTQIRNEFLTCQCSGSQGNYHR
jgi:hypothetical protein